MKTGCFYRGEEDRLLSADAERIFRESIKSSRGGERARDESREGTPPQFERKTSHWGLEARSDLQAGAHLSEFKKKK